MQPTLQGSCNALYGSCNEVFGDSSQLSTSIWSPKLLLSTNTIFWTIYISVENLLRSPCAVKLALGLFCDGRVALLVEFNVLQTLSDKKVFVMSMTSHMVLMPCKPSWHLAIAVHRGGFPGVGGCCAIFFLQSQAGWQCEQSRWCSEHSWCDFSREVQGNQCGCIVHTELGGARPFSKTDFLEGFKGDHWEKSLSTQSCWSVNSKGDFATTKKTSGKTPHLLKKVVLLCDSRQTKTERETTTNKTELLRSWSAAVGKSYLLSLLPIVHRWRHRNCIEDFLFSLCWFPQACWWNILSYIGELLKKGENMRCFPCTPGRMRLPHSKVKVTVLWKISVRTRCGWRLWSRYVEKGQLCSSHCFWREGNISLGVGW